MGFRLVYPATLTGDRQNENCCREVLAYLALGGDAARGSPPRWLLPPQTETTPMPVNLHQNARTTPAIRRELREATLPIAALARRYHLSQATVRQWRAARRPPTARIARIVCEPPARRPRRRWWWPGASPCCCPGRTSWR